jgi:hypothetical protein
MKMLEKEQEQAREAWIERLNLDKESECKNWKRYVNRLMKWRDRYELNERQRRYGQFRRYFFRKQKGKDYPAFLDTL